MAARAFAVLLLVASVACVPAQATPPADAFCVILIEGLDDFRTVRVLVDEETTIEERTALFPSVDVTGDGQITRDEGDAWRSGNTVTYSRGAGVDAVEAVHLSVVEGDVTRDLGPLYAAHWRQVGHTFHKQDHEQPWPVVEAADLETQEVRETRFPTEEARVVYVLGGLPRETATGSPTTTSGPTSSVSSGTIEYVVVRAPAGWRVAHVEGYTYDGWMSQSYEGVQTEVDLPAFDTKSSYRIRFEAVEALGTSSTTTGTPTTVPAREDGEFTIPVMGVGALLVLLALVARRRL